MPRNGKKLRNIILTVLLICTAFILYSLVTNPFGEHSIILPLVVSAGFVALGENKKVKKKSLK